MSPILLTALVAVANVLGAAMIMPQVLRIHRRRSVDGLSAAWVGVGIGLNLWWILYGTATGLWGLLPVSVGASVLYLTMVTQLVAISGRSELRGVARGFSLAATLPLAALVAGGWPAAGLAVGLAYAIQFAPATIAALRSPTIDAIAPLTWIMACIEAIIWLTYGLATADLALQVGGTGGAIMAGVILGRLALGDRSRDQMMAANA